MFLYNYRMHSLCIDENTYMMLKIKESLYYTYKKNHELTSHTIIFETF